jgi:hypothetical protein
MPKLVSEKKKKKKKVCPIHNKLVLSIYLVQKLIYRLRGGSKPRFGFLLEVGLCYVNNFSNE